MSDLQYFELQQQNQRPGQQPPAEEPAPEVEEAEEEPSPFTMYDNVLNFGFGATLIFGAYKGFTLNWLKDWIDNDTANFPEVALATGGYSRNWAYNTSEGTAWRQASQVMMGTYGTATALWLANTLMGNNAGSVHRVYYRMTQGFALLPLANLWMMFRVKNSYLINNWYDYYTFDQPNNEMWLFDATEEDKDEVNFLDTTEHNKEMWQGVWVNLLVSAVAIYAQDYNAKAWKYAHEQLAALDEEAEEEEPVEEEPVEEEEEIFF